MNTTIEIIQDFKVLPFVVAVVVFNKKFSCLMNIKWRFEDGCHANIYLFKVNSKNTRKRCEIHSKLAQKNHQNDVIESLWRFYC